MKTKILASISGLLVSLITPLAILVPQVSAAADTCTWTGAVDSNFSTSGNWSGCTGPDIPEDGDVIEIDIGTATDAPDNSILNNDIVGLNLAGINVTGASALGYGYKIEGSGITLSGDITGDATSGQVFLSLDITLGSNVQYSVDNGVVVMGDWATPYSLDLGNFDLTNSSSDAQCTGLYIASSLSGTGDIVSTTGSSLVVLYTGQTNFTGNVTINGAGLDLAPDVLLGWNSTVTMNNSSLLTFTGDATYDVNIVMNSDANPAIGVHPYGGFACGGGGQITKKTTTVTGSLTLLRDTIFSGAYDLIFDGDFTSNGHELSVKTGSTGAITTSDGTGSASEVTTTIDATDKTTADIFVVNKETTILNGERGNVFVNSGGILKGTGKATNIIVYGGGIVAPGASPGCLSSGGLVLAGSYQVEIAGKTVCTEYDQIVVTGTVNVTNGTLDTSFLNGFVPALNDSFIIINNDASDAVTGEFTGMADGSSFTVNGVTFQINYDGGDGNDVVLTATAVPATVTTPDTGIGQVLQNPMLTLMAVILSLGVLVGIKKAQTR